jgi:nitronate monooxygenase
VAGRIIELFKIEFPIVLTPTAGIMGCRSRDRGGALGSLPCAMISTDKAREQARMSRLGR